MMREPSSVQRMPSTTTVVASEAMAYANFSAEEMRVIQALQLRLQRVRQRAKAVKATIAEASAAADEQKSRRGALGEQRQKTARLCEQLQRERQQGQRHQQALQKQLEEAQQELERHQEHCRPPEDFVLKEEYDRAQEEFQAAVDLVSAERSENKELRRCLGLRRRQSRADSMATSRRPSTGNEDEASAGGGDPHHCGAAAAKPPRPGTLHGASGPASRQRLQHHAEASELSEGQAASRRSSMGNEEEAGVSGADSPHGAASFGRPWPSKPRNSTSQNCSISGQASRQQLQQLTEANERLEAQVTRERERGASLGQRLEVLRVRHRQLEQVLRQTEDESSARLLVLQESLQRSKEQVHHLMQLAALPLSPGDSPSARSTF